MFETSCRVSADLREHERLVDLAEAHQSMPDFSDVNTVREIMPTRLAPFIADLMAVFQMGSHAHRDELLKSCSKIEKAMYGMYRDL